MFHCRFFIYLYKLNLFLSYTWRMCWKSLIFHAFSLLSFRVINVNKFWMISSLEIISFFRNSVYFSRLRMIVLSTIVLCWFTLLSILFLFSLILFCTKLHASVFMSSSRTSLVFLYFSLLYALLIRLKWSVNPVSWSIGEWLGFNPIKPRGRGHFSPRKT